MWFQIGKEHVTKGEPVSKYVLVYYLSRGPKRMLVYLLPRIEYSTHYISQEKRNPPDF